MFELTLYLVPKTSDVSSAVWNQNFVMRSNRLDLPMSRLIFVSVTIYHLIFVSYTYRSSLADISRLPHKTKTGPPPDRGPRPAEVEHIPCYGPSKVPVIDSIAEQLGSVQLSGGRCK